MSSDPHPTPETPREAVERVWLFSYVNHYVTEPTYGAREFVNAEALATARREAEEARAETARLREALEPFAKAPAHGLWGGPLVQAILTYEDGSDEDTARHRGRLPHEAFTRARAALLPAAGDAPPQDPGPSMPFSGTIEDGVDALLAMSESELQATVTKTVREIEAKAMAPTSAPPQDPAGREE